MSWISAGPQRWRLRSRSRGTLKPHRISRHSGRPTERPDSRSRRSRSLREQGRAPRGSREARSIWKKFLFAGFLPSFIVKVLCDLNVNSLGQPTSLSSHKWTVLLRAGARLPRIVSSAGSCMVLGGSTASSDLVAKRLRNHQNPTSAKILRVLRAFCNPGNQTKSDRHRLWRI